MKQLQRHRKSRRWRIRRRTRPGASPGTITVDPAAPPPTIRVIAYSDTQMTDQIVDNVDDLEQFVGKHPVTWINVDGLGDASVIQKIGQLFNLHRLALEDVVNTHQRAKVEQYGETLFLVARMAMVAERVSMEQLSLFLGHNFVLTFQERPGDCFEPVRQRIRKAVGRMRTEGPDYLAYALLDATVDGYYPVLEFHADRLEALEDSVLARVDSDQIDRIHEMKRDLLLLRRAIWPHREALATLTREPLPCITESTRVYLRDCYDHVVQVVDLVTVYREMAADIRDLHMTMVSNRINETMRVLTVIATIFIPLTFVAGIYGMNFDHMPELHWYWGYPFSLALMAAITAAMLYYFHRAGWLGKGRK